MMDFETLYYFENDVVALVEIKRTDIVSENKSRIFFWLAISNGTTKQLHFREMGKNGATHYRIFEEGELHFDAEKAIWNGEILQPVSTPIPSELKKAITIFLGEL